MGNACEAFIYAPQGSLITPFHSTPGDFIALDVEVAGPDGAQWEVEDYRTLSSGRGVTESNIIAKPTGGTIQVPFFDAGLASLLKTFMINAITAGSGPYTHGMIFDDTEPLDFFSAQLYYNDDMALSLVGGVINTWQMTAAKKARVSNSFGWEGKDLAKSSADSVSDGLFWNYDGTVNTPDLIDPFDLYPSRARGLFFFDGTVQRSGTFTFNPTTNITNVAGSPSELSKLTSIQMSLNNNVDTDGYFIQQDPTRDAFCAQNRDIELAFEFDWCDQSVEIWELAQADAPISLSVELKKTATLGASLFFPAVYLKPFALPNLSGDKAKRTISVTGVAHKVAVTNTTTGETNYDMNLVVYNNESSI